MIQRAVCVQLQTLSFPISRRSIHIIRHNLDCPIIILLPAPYLLPTARQQLLDRPMRAVTGGFLEPAEVIRYEVSMWEALGQMGGKR